MLFYFSPYLWEDHDTFLAPSPRLPGLATNASLSKLWSLIALIPISTSSWRGGSLIVVESGPKYQQIWMSEWPDHEHLRIPSRWLVAKLWTTCLVLMDGCHGCQGSLSHSSWAELLMNQPVSMRLMRDKHLCDRQFSCFLPIIIATSSHVPTTTAVYTVLE